MLQNHKIADVVAEFFRRRRLQVNVVRSHETVALVSTDDDQSLVNTVIAVNNIRDIEWESKLLKVFESGDFDPARTDIVIPDGADYHLTTLDASHGENFRRAHYISEFLDSYLRPMDICRQLIDEAADPMPDALLSEDDFVDQWASSPGNGRTKAIEYLFQQWAAGNSPRMCMLLAPAGHGKSKITHILAKRLARSYGSANPGERPPLPFLISFGTVRRATSFQGLILSKLDSGRGTNQLSLSAFQYLVSLGRVIFILDGYDEMVEAVPDTARDNISEFIANAGPASRILLTSRSVFFRTSIDVLTAFSDPLLEHSDVEVLDLLPFDHGQAKEYLSRRLRDVNVKGRTLERAQKVLESPEGLSVLSSPIFLAEFVESIMNKTWSITDIRKSGFVEYLVSRTFQRERERQNHDYTDAEQRDFLQRIAFDMLFTGEAGYTRDDLELFALEAIHEEEEIRHWNTLASHHFLLELHSNSSRVTIRHQVWREYFQGVALAERIRADHSSLNKFTKDIPEGVHLTCAARLNTSDMKLLINSATNADRQLFRNLYLISSARPDFQERTKLHHPIAEALQNRDLSSLRFQSLDFSGYSLAGSDITSSTFIDCNLENTSFERTLINRTVFENCSIGSSIEDADIASAIIDDESFFGPQIASYFSRQDNGGSVERTSAENREIDYTDWASEILRSRLAKFVKIPPGPGAVAILDQNISLTAFMGGLDPRWRDYVTRRLYKALRTSDIIFETRHTGGDRPTVHLSREASVRNAVLGFVEGEPASELISEVLERAGR